MVPLRAVVVGAGISGLAFAHRLHVLAQQAGRPLELTLLESSNHAGGVIATLRHEDCLLETGPDCWAGNKPAGVSLCRELGLQDQLIGTRAGLRRSFILHKGKLQRLPEGFFLISPMSVGALLATPLLTFAGKLRMGLDLLRPARRDTGDESLADFVRRRFGREALERIAQPMVAGIYNADPEKLSLQATFPQFLEMERNHGSVIRALRKKAAAEARSGTSSGAEIAKAAGPRYGMFVSLARGMSTLPDALAAALPQGCLHLNTPVTGLTQAGGTWQVQTASGQHTADLVCLALPAHASARLLQPAHAQAGAALAAFEYGGATVVNFVFDRVQVKHAMDGMGAVIPVVEGRDIVAFSFSSVKFEGRAPEGKAVVRVFMGGALHPRLSGLSTDALAEVALRELRDLVGIEGQPRFTFAATHDQAMAQYHVGHLERVKQARNLLAEIGGLSVIGNAFDGVGIPDCIRGAEEAARQALATAR